MDKGIKVIIFSLFINTLLTILKFVVGIFGKSSALIADGVHSMSDLVTDIFSIIGAHIANKPADEKHPFGHGKMEYIISLGISLVVIFIGLVLFNTGVNSKTEVPEIIVLVVSISAIVIKFLLANFIVDKGNEYNNNILIAGGIESKMDVYSSLVVMFSTFLMLMSEYISIFKYADKVAIIFVSIMIINVGIKLLIENGSLLLEEKVLDDKINNRVHNIIIKPIEVIDVPVMHIFKYGKKYKLVANIIMHNDISLIDARSVVEGIEKSLHDKCDFEYIYINMEPVSDYLDDILSDNE